MVPRGGPVRSKLQTDNISTLPCLTKSQHQDLVAPESCLAHLCVYLLSEPGSGAQTEMKKKVDKWQEPAPAKQHKVLPVPDMEPKKRRGGRRFRKMKERYGLTDMRKAANR